MALADLMKKGFLTSATATFATVATRSRTGNQFGEFATATGATVATVGGKQVPSVATVASVAVAKAPILNWPDGSVASVATVAVANFKYQKPKLPEPWRHDLVAEFMEVDGLTLEQAEAMAAISVQPRTPAAWLAMIAELNTLISRYCESAEFSAEAKAQIYAASYSQSLASIPNAIDWFRAELMADIHILKVKND